MIDEGDEDLQIKHTSAGGTRRTAQVVKVHFQVVRQLFFVGIVKPVVG